MTYQSFIQQLITLKEAISVTGNAKYKSIQISGDRIMYVRESTGNQEYLLLSELFELAEKEALINTVIARKYITGWKYSPACALLIASGISKRL